MILRRYVILCLFAINGCNTLTEVIIDQTPKLVYSNSFESPVDTSGWTGFGELNLSSDVPPGGGTHSLSVQGTDIAPQAEKVLEVPADSGQLIFRFWAKSRTHNSGVVRLISLAPVEPYPAAGFAIVDTVWKAYSDTAFFPAGYNLRIWIDGDGWSGNPVLVDNIEVLRIPE